MPAALVRGRGSHALERRDSRVLTVEKNKLYFGDNLDVLPQHIADESVDLVYLDPPFNSNRNYSVIFSKHAEVEDDNAQIQAFEDTWHWHPGSEKEYAEFVTTAAGKVADALTAFRTLLGENDAMAYLVNMAPRLVEMHRVLKPTGSLYLHCDPTMSHYLKILLDGIFDPRNFRNEIVWKRTAAKGLSTTRLARNHDVILNYTKTNKAYWNLDAAFIPYDLDDLDEKTAAKYKHTDEDGRVYRLSDLTNPNPDRPNLTYEFMGMTKVWRWTKDRMKQAFEDGLIVQTEPGTIPQLKRYIDEQRGRPLNDVWADIPPLNSQAAERLGYPTQKPVALLERIIEASTKPGDLVLDPFCGCGTSVDAAQKLGRRWVGIDITYIAVDLIIKRLDHTYGDSITDTFDVAGIPKDLAGAQAMFDKDPFEFERWAVSLVGAQPNQKQVGDKGVDGIGRFLLDNKGGVGKIIVSVKGGKTVNPAMVRELQGAVKAQGAQMGVLVTITPATKGVTDAINHGGVYTHPAAKQAFPVLQHVTVAELMAGQRPKLPLMYKPYIEAKRQKINVQTGTLF